jgi:hypothetical protein
VTASTLWVIDVRVKETVREGGNAVTHLVLLSGNQGAQSLYMRYLVPANRKFRRETPLSLTIAAAKAGWHVECRTPAG